MPPSQRGACSELNQLSLQKYSQNTPTTLAYLQQPSYLQNVWAWFSSSPSTLTDLAPTTLAHRWSSNALGMRLREFLASSSWETRLHDGTRRKAARARKLKFRIFIKETASEQVTRSWQKLELQASCRGEVGAFNDKPENQQLTRPPRPSRLGNNGGIQETGPSRSTYPGLKRKKNSFPTYDEDSGGSDYAAPSPKKKRKATNSRRTGSTLSQMTTTILAPTPTVNPAFNPQARPSTAPQDCKSCRGRQKKCGKQEPNCDWCRDHGIECVYGGTVKEARVDAEKARKEKKALKEVTEAAVIRGL
ncbi:uncharacterized protein PAC_03901 [Phialocephala subalpina]|uniref:Zn(2)-C6 fungal-type domain-containing protein n=1 Tax=Phialocephala subalpina TaxID=576137 RepID=A0A1L7WMP7_9HELO|nr:uncharacterized protein PAC_03901 [Phialocephala subalpina]